MGDILEITQFDRLLRALCVIVFVKLFSFYITTLHCLIEDTCLQFGRTQFLLDAFFCTLDDHLKD